MAKLWQGLSKVSCGQTLLQVTNIGLDESETLVIRQIFPDEPNNPPELEQLLNFWLQLLPDSKLQETKIVLKLLSLLNTGEVKNIKQLRSTMQTLSQEKQLQSLSVEEKNEDLLLLEAEDELEALSAQFDVDDYGEDLSTRVVSPVEDINDQPTIVLPMDLLSLTDAAYTDIGTRRSHNEDCFASDTRINKQESPQGTILRARGLYLVCDGMGGHAGGEVASAMAVQNISDYFQEHWQEKLPDVEVIKQGILQANQAIYRTNLQKGSSGSQRMGTTLVMVLIEGTKVVLVNVGDSRIYQLTRKSGLEQLTRDHCVAQMEIKRGVNPEIAYQRMDAFQLTQALGPRDDHFVHPDITFMDIKEDTLFILCSDGLCDNNLLENNWQTYLSPLISSKADLNEGLSQIIDLANQVNGHDNITAVLVRVKVQPNLDKQKS
jgi:protein phosphatase